MIVGGIIPEADDAPLKPAGVAGVYTPEEFDISVVVADIVRIVAEANGVLDEAHALRRAATGLRRAARAAG